MTVELIDGRAPTGSGPLDLVPRTSSVRHVRYAASSRTLRRLRRSVASERPHLAARP